MFRSVSKIQKAGAVFMIFLSCATAFNDAEEEKTINLKLGFDLTRGKNGAPSLRIRNFEEVPEYVGSNKEKARKKALRAESSSESLEPDNDKIALVMKKPQESDGSEEIDSSGSDNDRRLSTKGISPDEFDPERNPNIHGRNDKVYSDSE